MSILDFFEDMRRANADFYTASPFEQMSDDELAALASEAGMSLDELKQHINTPHVEMTCPLCGRPSTHLVGCKGCGGDAWGGEWVMAHGEDMHDRLRKQFRSALTNPDHLADFRQKLEAHNEPMPIFEIEQINYAVKHAYEWGGCSICSVCWHHTLPTNAYESCPLKLLADRFLTTKPLPWSVEFRLIEIEDKQKQIEIITEWINSTWSHWVNHWNTVADPDIRRAIAAWRHLILEAVWQSDERATK